MCAWEAARIVRSFTFVAKQKMSEGHFMPCNLLANMIRNCDFVIV
jgi:hypothetical protein